MNSFIAPRFRIFVAEVGFLADSCFGVEVEDGGKVCVVPFLATDRVSLRAGS
jgi:hypothetical protein